MIYTYMCTYFYTEAQAHTYNHLCSGAYMHIKKMLQMDLLTYAGT